VDTEFPNDPRVSSAEEIFAALPAAILLVDNDGRYTFANPAACQLLARPLNEILGHTPGDFSGDEFDFASSWQSFTADGSQEGEFPIRRPDGTILTARFSAVTDFLPGRHLSVLHDVSDRKRVEMLLRHNEELFMKAFLASPAPTNIRKLNSGVFIEVNDAFTQSTGYWRSDVIGRSGKSIGLWKDAGQLDDLLARMRQGEGSVTTRAILATKDRREKDYSVAMRRIDIHGEAHVVAAYTDVAAI
jgi:PAS domain S-box-containing protein